METGLGVTESIRSPGIRPVRGLALLLFSALASAAVLVYLAGWSASERASARAAAAAQGIEYDGSLWEGGALWACPIH